MRISAAKTDGIECVSLLQRRNELELDDRQCKDFDLKCQTLSNGGGKQQYQRLNTAPTLQHTRSIPFAPSSFTSVSNKYQRVET
jgi:hypothetical protein